MALHKFIAPVFGMAVLAAGGMLAWHVFGARYAQCHLPAPGRTQRLRSMWRDIEGIRMHARVSTAGSSHSAPPLILVHGFAVSGTYWVPVAKRLAASLSVYVPDLPGHGKSETPCTPLDVPALARALVAWMDAAGIRRASLVGHSMGCQVAVEAALRFPERVDRLVLIGPTVDPYARDVVKQLQRLLISSMHERPSLFLHLLKDFIRIGRRLLPELHFLMQDRIESKLPRLTMPVMLVRGELDALVPQRWLHQAARLLRTQRIAEIPAWGHAVHYSAAEQVSQAIRPFLEAINPASSPGKMSSDAFSCHP